MKTALRVSPLCSYLSALGLLKVLNRQIDPAAQGFWQQGVFHLSTGLTLEGLIDFLANTYRPGPFLTPWNKPKEKGPSFLGGQVPLAVKNLQGERYAAIHGVAAIAAEVLPPFVRDGRIGKEEKSAAFEELSQRANNDAFAAWLKLCAVTTRDGEGKISARFPVLLGGSGGYMAADFGTQFLNSLAIVKAEHFRAAIVGSTDPGIQVNAGNTLIYDPFGRGDGQQGYRVAINDTQTAKANPAELILLAEGMALFEGYATTSQQDIAGQSGTQQASFTLAVVHNSSLHPSSSWLENGGSQTEELWCPLWDQPCGFDDVREALGRVALMPLPRQLQTGTDFALFATQLGRQQGLSGFARYCFPARIGQGTKIPSLIEVFALSDGQEDRSDALADLARFASTLRWRSRDTAVPASHRHAAERVVADLEVLSGGGGSFAGLLRQLVAWRRQEELRQPDQQAARFRFSRRELPPLWFDLLAREIDGPEWRLALALATGRPYASCSDVLLLLEGRLDADLVNDLELGIGWIERRGLPRLPSLDTSIPWLPPDYLAGVLLNQWLFSAPTAVPGDRARWRELLLADRPAEAMAIALQRLRMAEVVSWPWPVITHSDPRRLLRTVEVPVHPMTLTRLRKQ
ncbi:MAG: type I-U CRISPR-associated protein Csx17 [Cyanobacteriota bacterium]